MAVTAGLPEQLSRLFVFRMVSNKRSRHDGPVCGPLEGVPDCEIAILEFDDQGLCFARRAMDELKAVLDRLDGTNPIIAVFVHGWKHNGSEQDGNLDRSGTL